MKVRIVVSPSCFVPIFIMEIDVPDDRDAEEYIDDLLDTIFSQDHRYNCEWEFET